MTLDMSVKKAERPGSTGPLWPTRATPEYGLANTSVCTATRIRK